MSGVNKVILVGNCGQDPDTRYTAEGKAVTNITIATSESWKDKNTGERQERTEWHKVVFFNRLAEIAGEYLKKGKKVYIEGQLRTRSWERDGIKRHTTEIIAKEMQLLGSLDTNSSDKEGITQAQGAVNQDKEATKFDDDIPF